MIERRIRDITTRQAGSDRAEVKFFVEAKLQEIKSYICRLVKRLLTSYPETGHGNQCKST